jgi:putative transposase
VQDRPPARENADEADRHTGTLSPSANDHPEPGHKIYPYLLRDLQITRPNQVWAMDITYIPMARGFVYLVVVLDWFSRRLLAWRLSVTMEASFCVEALEDALAHNGKPEIVNTDQGAQFTGSAFTGVLTKHSVDISMDGKGAWRDNVFVERLWRTIILASL